MQTLDVILGIFLLYGLVKGFVKGLVNEVAALVALLLGLWGRFHWPIILCRWSLLVLISLPNT